MAQTVTWAESALKDLESIAAFIARDSPHYAVSTIDDLFSAAEALGDFPQAGRIVPEYGNPALRELIKRPYRVVYKIESGQIRIVAIVHSAQPMPELPPKTGE